MPVNFREKEIPATKNQYFVERSRNFENATNDSMYLTAQEEITKVQDFWKANQIEMPTSYTIANNLLSSMFYQPLLNEVSRISASYLVMIEINARNWYLCVKSAIFPVHFVVELI